MTSPWFIEEFEWDEANVDHLWERHQVEPEEAEEVLLGEDVRIRKGRLKKGEAYYEALGSTAEGRYLFVVFQLKGKGLIRVASARPMSRAERKWYARKSKAK